MLRDANFEENRQNPRRRIEKASKMKEKSGFANEIRNAGCWLIGTRCEHARRVCTLFHVLSNEIVRKRTK